jgi:hypothetical protein
MTSMLTLIGGASIDAYVQAANLQADIVKIGIQGSGNVDVNSIDALTAEINGSGNIKYIGTPSKLNTRVRGSGTIVNQ